MRLKKRAGQVQYDVIGSVVFIPTLLHVLPGCLRGIEIATPRRPAQQNCVVLNPSPRNCQDFRIIRVYATNRGILNFVSTESSMVKVLLTCVHHRY